MLVRGVQRRPGLNRRWLAVAAIGALAALMCSLSFVAGGQAYRQGMFHAWREQGLAMLNPGRRLEAWTRAPVPDTVVLDVDFEHWRTIEARREQALDAGLRFGEEMDPVPARLTIDGGSLDVDIRLRGRALDHFQGEKWSFRLRVKGDAAVRGMRRFSLQHPGTRGYEREWLYHRMLQLDGGLGLRYDFVRLVLNGKDLGIYAIEEHFGKELLESQRRREGPIVKFDHSDRLLRRAMGVGDELVVGGGNFSSTPLTVYGEGKVDDSPALSAQRESALHLFRAFATGNRLASDVFDVERLARFSALADLFGTWHPLAFHNTRFYYDPVAERLEPIGYDANSCLDGRFTLNALSAPWLRAAIADPVFSRAYVAALNAMSQPAWLASVRGRLGPALDDAALLLSREWPVESETVWQVLEDRQAAIRDALDIGSLAQGIAMPTETAGEVELEIYNNTNLAVEIVAIEADGVRVACAAPLVLPAAGDALPAPTRVRVSTPAPLGHRVIAHARLAGHEATRPCVLHVEDAHAAGRPPAQTVEQALAAHPFLVSGAPDVLHVPSGTWHVDGDLVVPAGMQLDIEPGAVLRFDHGAALFTTGAVRCLGRADAPVRLEPNGEAWGGIVVLGSAVPSAWTHTVVSGTTGLSRGGWMTTGGVTFQNSPAVLRFCRFEMSHGEDALNAVRTTITIEDSDFVRCASDAFDGDFTTVRVTDCRFEDIAGDAVDLSGSTSLIERVVAVDIGDKAVSGGERSRVVVRELHVRGAAIGVACKDDSFAEVRDAIVEDACVALAAYQKKVAYGPGRIDASGVRFRGVDDVAMAQHRSEILVNGVRTATRAFTVDELAARSALRMVEAGGGASEENTAWH